jgi:plastocyanin
VALAIPRFLIAVPLILAGAFLPALGSDPVKAPPGAVGMTHEYYAKEEVTVHRGDSIVFTNDSRYMHIIGPGFNGVLADEAGTPMQGRALVETNDSYTVGPFTQVGTFWYACSMHPKMNIKVIVVE